MCAFWNFSPYLAKSNVLLELFLQNENEAVFWGYICLFSPLIWWLCFLHNCHWVWQWVLWSSLLLLGHHSLIPPRFESHVIRLHTHCYSLLLSCTNSQVLLLHFLMAWAPTSLSLICTPVLFLGILIHI